MDDRTIPFSLIPTLSFGDHRVPTSFGHFSCDELRYAGHICCVLECQYVILISGWLRGVFLLVLCCFCVSSMLVLCRSCAGLVSVSCRFYVGPVLVLCCFCVSFMLVLCRSYAGLVSVLCWYRPCFLLAGSFRELQGMPLRYAGWEYVYRWVCLRRVL